MRKKYFVVVGAIIAIAVFDAYAYINSKVNKPERVRCFPKRDSVSVGLTTRPTALKRKN